MTSLETLLTPATLGPLCAFFSSVTWAVGTTAYSKLAKRYPPFIVNFSRALTAFVLFLFVNFALGGFSAFTHVTTDKLIWLAGSTLCSYAFADVLFLWSTRSLGTPAALAIASTYPIWAALAAWLIRGEALGFGRGIGVLLSVAGTLVIILSGYSVHRKKQSAPASAAAFPQAISSFWIGVTLAFLTSFLWAMNALSVAEGSQGMPALTAVTVRMFFAMVLSPIVGMLLLWPTIRKSGLRSHLPDRKTLKVNLWVFAFEGFGGSLFYTYGMANSPIAAAAVLSSLAPVISLPIAWKFGHEPMPPAKIAGVVMVMAGVWLIM